MLQEVKKKPVPRRQSILVRILIFLITVALLMGAVALIAARDRINLDSIRRYLAYRTMLKNGENGAGQPFLYDGGEDSAAATVGGDLLCLSQSGVRLYDPSGQAFIDETAVLKNPACSAAGNAVVVYDAGGTFLKVYQNRSEVFALEESGGVILSARIGEGGYLAVVTRADGYKGVVTVYDTKYRPVAAFRLSSRFVMDAIPAPDNKAVAVVTAGQDGHTFESRIATYAIRSDLPSGEAAELSAAAELSLGNGVVLDLRWTNAGIRALTEQGIVTADSQLTQTGGTDWTGEYLKEFSQVPADFSVALVARYRAGNTARLISVDASGEVLGILEVNEQILSITAAGRYAAVVTSGGIVLYNRDLTPYARLSETGGAHRAVLRSDGSLMLLSSESAWLRVPE